MHSTQLQEVNITTGGIMNGDTRCNKNIGMNNMVKVNLVVLLMKFIALTIPDNSTHHTLSNLS